MVHTRVQCHHHNIPPSVHTGLQFIVVLLTLSHKFIIPCMYLAITFIIPLILQSYMCCTCPSSNSSKMYIAAHVFIYIICVCLYIGGDIMQKVYISICSVPCNASSRRVLYMQDCSQPQNTYANTIIYYYLQCKIHMQCSV